MDPDATIAHPAGLSFGKNRKRVRGVKRPICLGCAPTRAWLASSRIVRGVRSVSMCVHQGGTGSQSAKPGRSLADDGNCGRHHANLKIDLASCSAAYIHCTGNLAPFFFLEKARARTVVLDCSLTREKMSLESSLGKQGLCDLRNGGARAPVCTLSNKKTKT